MWNRGEISPLFHNIFDISLTSGVKLHIHLLNVIVRFIVFLTSATLIFRGTDILKCFRESLGIRDNESRLYLEKKQPFSESPHHRIQSSQDTSKEHRYIAYNTRYACVLWKLFLDKAIPRNISPFKCVRKIICSKVSLPNKSSFIIGATGWLYII